MLSIRFRSFETRIVVFFVALLAFVQIAAFLIVSAATDSISSRELAREIAVGERVLEGMLERSRRQLAQAGLLFAVDRGFQAAVQTRDVAAIRAAISRLDANAEQHLTMVADPDGRLLADTHQGNLRGQAFPFPPLMDTARRDGSASAVVIIDDQPYDLVVVPVLAPEPVAWIARGIRLDHKLAEDMRGLTGLQVSFLVEVDDQRWHVSGSTLPVAERDSLLTRITDILRAQAATTPLSLISRDYQTRAIRLTGIGARRVIAVWQQSLHAALDPFRELQKTLLDLAIASVFASLFGGILLGRRLTQPISKLAETARQARAGDYSKKSDIKETDEIGDLAAGFNHLRDAISAREQKIKRLAYQDTLTSLPNRALFNDRLDLALKAAERDQKPMSILTMGIDRFRQINDTLGHPVGDRVLLAVGERLLLLLRKSDTVARLGGDEFAVILPKGDTQHASEVAAKILSAHDTPITIDGHTLDVRFSIGIASYPEHGTDPYHLLRNADIAMYVAKRGKRGYSVFEPDATQPHQDYLNLLGELKRAVEHDELVLYYQPKVDLNSGTTTQAEALVRWVHPQRGLVPPLQFIPFAEQTGYIRTMTRWIIRRAIRQCETWQAQGINITISVNICASDLLDPGLIEMIATELKQRRVDARWLSMEITENGVMEDPAKSLETLRQLDQLGIELAIDDYGTGYSSLSYVKKLPVSELKIDQSFVRDMTTDADDAMIVKSTIDLGHNMGMRVIAEGVEDLAIWALLRQMGCDGAQGYCMSKPLPAEQFEQWLRANPVFGDPTIPPARLASHGASGSALPASSAQAKGNRRRTRG